VNSSNGSTFNAFATAPELDPIPAPLAGFDPSQVIGGGIAVR